MKRWLQYLSFLLCMLLTSSAFAIPVAIMSGGVNPCYASGCTWPGYVACWTGDYPGDDDELCVNGGTSTKDGTVTGTIHTDYGKTGNGIRIDAQDEHIWWPVVGEDIWSCDAGTFCVDLYLSDSVAEQQFYEAIVDGDNGLRVKANIANTIFVFYEWELPGSGAETVTSAAVGDEVWVEVCVTWQVDGTDDLDIIINGAAPVNADTMNVCTDAGFNLYLGENARNEAQDDLWVDNYRSSNTYMDSNLSSLW